MFFKPLLTRVSRGRAVGLAALVGLCATGATTASAQATTAVPPAGDAVIASASGTTIDTTSGSRVTVGRTEGRSAGSDSGTLTLNSSDPVTATAAQAPAAKASTGTQIAQTNLESPIVGSTSHRPSASPRAALAQLQSGGPIVALSGTAGDPTRSTHSREVVTGTARGSRAYGSRAPIAAGSTIQINAPGVSLYIPQNAARRPASDTRTASPARNLPQAGRPGAGYSGLLPADPRPAPSPSGPANTTLFGSGSGPAGGSSLLGIDALFAIAALLVGAAWRRRSWDLPVLARQSALLSLALDRPG